MNENKRYFFRDLDHNSNLYEGKAYHAAGLADLFEKIDNPSFSGKDVAVTYLHPFTGEVIHAWRSFDEIELYEAYDFEYKEMEMVLNRCSNCT